MQTGKYAAAGAKLKALRERKRFSHDRLAALVGSSRQHLIRLEKGWHKPKPEMAAKLGEALGEPIDFYDAEDDGDGEKNGVAAELMAMPVGDLLATLMQLTGAAKAASRDGVSA